MGDSVGTKPHCQKGKTLDRQHGFSKGRSTDSALTSMMEHIESALSNKGFALGVFLDIQGAFDNVNPNSILLGMVEKILSRL